MAFDSWWDYLESEITDILEKSRPYHAFSEQEERQIQYVLEKNKALLNEVTVPQLVHADLWEGNVLIRVQGGEYNVAAIIHVDRAVIGDVDFEFATQWMINGDFLKGYDPNFDYADFHSKERTTRRKIYGLLFYLIEAYVGIAEFNNKNQYLQNKKSILSLLSELMG
jgi:fructosamine-3-kinase